MQKRCNNDGQYCPAVTPECKGRGGKRAGAGRPVGTKKEDTKKKFSFRLSVEEEKAVRDLLKKMRNK